MVFYRSKSEFQCKRLLYSVIIESSYYNRSYRRPYSKYRRTGGSRYSRPSYSSYGFKNYRRRGYSSGNRYYRRSGVRNSFNRNYGGAYSTNSTRFDNGRETRVFKNTTTTGTTTGYKRDKSINIWETTDWSAIPTTLGGNRVFLPYLSYCVGVEKATEWLNEWVYFEIKALYWTAELHNVVGVYLNSLPANKVVITGDPPSMPTVGVYLDTWYGTEGNTSNYPSTDRAFSEQQNVKFIMKGRPVTFTWHQPSVLRGKKWRTADKLAEGSLGLIDLATLYDDFGNEGKWNCPRALVTRLFDQDLYDWTGSYTSKFSLAFKMSMYVKLTGSKKYREIHLSQGKQDPENIEER